MTSGAAKGGKDSELIARQTYSVPSVRWYTTTMATVTLPRCPRRWASPNQAKDWESHLPTTTKMATSTFLLRMIPWQSSFITTRAMGPSKKLDCPRVLRSTERDTLMLEWEWSSLITTMMGFRI